MLNRNAEICKGNKNRAIPIRYEGIFQLSNWYEVIEYDEHEKEENIDECTSK